MKPCCQHLVENVKATSNPPFCVLVPVIVTLTWTGLLKRLSLQWGLEGNSPAGVTPATTGKYMKYNFQMPWFRSYIFKAKFDGQSLDSQKFCACRLQSFVLHVITCWFYLQRFDRQKWAWQVSTSRMKPFWELQFFTVIIQEMKMA